MSVCGYKRKFQPPPCHVRLSPNSRHFSRHVRFRIVFVCFWGISGRAGSMARTAAFSQEETFKHPATSIEVIPLDCHFSS